MAICVKLCLGTHSLFGSGRLAALYDFFIDATNPRAFANRHVWRIHLGCDNRRFAVDFKGGRVHTINQDRALQSLVAAKARRPLPWSLSVRFGEIRQAAAGRKPTFKASPLAPGPVNQANPDLRMAQKLDIPDRPQWQETWFC